MWQPVQMRGPHTVIVGDGGSVVIPIEVRERVGLDDGTPLFLLNTPGALVLMTRHQHLARVRGELEGLDLVDELLAERRRDAEREDAA